jgi:hypothetical protein
MRTSITVLLLLLIGIKLDAQNISSEGVAAPKDNMTVIDFFTVTCNEKIWDIKWKALSEIDACKYVLEYSTDQINWVEYKVVQGTVHTTGVYTYNSYMKRNNDSTNYFRLQYDCTSTIVMYKSPVMNICPDYIPDVTIPDFIVDYNNSERTIQVGSNGYGNTKSTVMVYSSIGQLIYHNEIMLNSVNSKISIPLATNSHGILIVNISNGTKSVSRKILIP